MANHSECHVKCLDCGQFVPHKTAPKHDCGIYQKRHTKENKIVRKRTMDTPEQALKKITALRKDGDSCYFNMFQDGGAVCYLCNGMYLLFEVPLYGGLEKYEDIYFETQLNDLISKAYSWT